MNVNSVKIEKIVTTSTDTFHVRMWISRIALSYKEDIEIIIDKVNNTNLRYSYTTRKDISNENRYINATYEAIHEYYTDKSVKDLIDWDGNVDYQSFKLKQDLRLIGSKLDTERKFRKGLTEESEEYRVSIKKESELLERKNELLKNEVEKLENDNIASTQELINEIVKGVKLKEYKI